MTLLWTLFYLPLLAQPKKKEKKKKEGRGRKKKKKHHAGSGNWENIKRDLLSIKSNKSLKMKLSCVSVWNSKVKV